MEESRVRHTQVLPGLPVLGDGGIGESGLARGLWVERGHGLRRGAVERSLDGTRLLQRVLGAALKNIDFGGEEAAPLPGRRSCLVCVGVGVG